MKYSSAMAYIEETKERGIVLGLSSIEELCRRCGNPQDSLRFIQVAGTNGKGSVTSFLASVLQAAGYKTGCYVSPEVFSYLEKIRVNQKNISKRLFGAWMDVVKDTCEQMVRDGFDHPTAFEIETALAFLYFKEAKCDYVLLEAGMGGQMDATNIVTTTVLSILTRIGMDHMQFLGKSLGEIAAQKAGIFKAGVPAVTSWQKEEAMCVIREKAKASGSRLFVAEQNMAENVRYGFFEQSFDFRMPEMAYYKDLIIHMSGTYQIENASVAVCAVEALREQGIVIPEKALRTGLQKASWQGRLSVIREKPLFLVDGAHNEDAVRALSASVRQYFPNRNLICIVGVLRDKDCESMAEAAPLWASHIITVTPPGNPRALPALELAQEFRKHHDSVTAADGLHEAVETSLLLADKDSVILAFGSLSYLGELKGIVEEMTGGSDAAGKRKA